MIIILMAISFRHTSPSGSTGFTIVELLIVIVVIGILAAITIVALNGIQQRSKFAGMGSEVRSIVKALELYKN